MYAHSESLIVAILGAALGLAQASAQLPPDARLAGETWLQKDCGVGEQDQLKPILRMFKPQFEQFFLNALNNGPPAQLMAQVEETASTTFDLLEAALKTGKGLGLSEADLNDLRMVTREQYVAREREDFAINYKSRAVSGLGIVAGDRGKTVLQALAADPLSPLRGGARESLLQLRPAPGKAGAKK
ncbi:MAG: hypothetical protein LAO55_16020 [Acidobacteriia bacterium]|nr:hypothetical protein [Terriglobia bacterium]